MFGVEAVFECFDCGSAGVVSDDGCSLAEESREVCQNGADVGMLNPLSEVGEREAVGVGDFERGRAGEVGVQEACEGV